MPINLPQEAAENDRIRNEEQTYEIEASSLPSSSDYDDEVDSLDEEFYSSILSFDSQKVPIKTERSASTVSRKYKETKTMRTPIKFAPRSPKNYKKPEFRKSHSSGSITLNTSDHHKNHEQNQSDVFDSPIFRSKSDLKMATIIDDGNAFPFPSPFSSPHNSVNFGDFSTPVKISEDKTKRIANRRISEGDASRPLISDTADNPFQKSMNLVDVFPSVVDEDSFRPCKSMPEMLVLFEFESSPSPSSPNGGKKSGGDLSRRGSKSLKQTVKIDPFDDIYEQGNDSRGSKSLEEAMEIDPFDDDCVHFEHNQECDREQTSDSVDLVNQMQALQEHHKEEVNKLQREIETSNRIITSLTKEVEELVAKNEKLSIENKKLKESKQRNHNPTSVDMESPPASPSVQQRHCVEDSSDREFTDRSDGELEEKKRQSKRKASKKRKSKKAHRSSTTGDSTANTHEAIMALKDTDQTTGKRPSKANTGTSKKKRKSKRSSKLWVSSSSLADEHPLSQTKRRRSSMEVKLQSHTNATSEVETRKTNKRRSSKRLPDTIENIWGVEWKDPAAKPVEGERDSYNKKKHLVQFKENLEASVGKLPKRKKKRKTGAKSSKAKQATSNTVVEDSNTALKHKPTIPKSPKKKAKLSSRKTLAVVGRILSPKFEKRRKRDSSTSNDGSDMIQNPEALPEL